jgi:hypothetical protein
VLVAGTKQSRQARNQLGSPDCLVGLSVASTLAYFALFPLKKFYNPNTKKQNKVQKVGFIHGHNVFSLCQIS